MVCKKSILLVPIAWNIVGRGGGAQRPVIQAFIQRCGDVGEIVYRMWMGLLISTFECLFRTNIIFLVRRLQRIIALY